VHEALEDLLDLRLQEDLLDLRLVEDRSDLLEAVHLVPSMAVDLMDQRSVRGLLLLLISCLALSML
jgi:hypothetical protein